MLYTGLIWLGSAQGVAEAESRRAADAAEQAYREAFNRDVSADEAQLDAEHSRALAVAQAVFNDKAVGETQELQPPSLFYVGPISCMSFLGFYQAG